MAASETGGMSLIDHVTNISDLIWVGTWMGEPLLTIAGEPFPPMVIILFGIGLYIMVGLRFYPLVKLGSAFAGLFKSRKSEGDGEISPFAALSTALSGQVGTGNLAGVATAIAMGGPGAVFWMWITAIFGMALAFGEGSLAIRYRERTEDGAYRGGPMTYIMLGLGPKYTWLAIVFCIGALFSAMVTGNSIQANAVADGLNELFGIAEWMGGAIVAVLVFVVIIGGIKSIGSVAEKVIPFMRSSFWRATPAICQRPLVLSSMARSIRRPQPGALPEPRLSSQSAMPRSVDSSQTRRAKGPPRSRTRSRRPTIPNSRAAWRCSARSSTPW